MSHRTSQTTYYPPWRYRLRAVLKACDDAGDYFPVTAEAFPKEDKRADRINEAIANIRRLTEDRSDDQVIYDPVAQLTGPEAEHLDR